MSNKKSQVKQLAEENKKEDDKVKKAMEVLQAEEKKKVNAFMEDYKAVCFKHGMELSATPVVKWGVQAIQK